MTPPPSVWAENFILIADPNLYGNTKIFLTSSEPSDIRLWRRKIEMTQFTAKKSPQAKTEKDTLQYLLRVDREGRPLGFEEKEKCHRGRGIWHSAFLVMVFDGWNRLMLARRSHQKKLWPDFWDGTVAGHISQGLSPEQAPRARVREELGATCDTLEFIFEFPYQSNYEDVGIEKEVCRIFKAHKIPRSAISPNEAEISEFRFSSLSALRREVENRPSEFTPWFLLAFAKLPRR